MLDFETSSTKEESAAKTEKGVWWSEYAKKYDEFVVPLTCYQDNISQLINFLSSSTVPADAKICDLGAGTGIYISAMSKIRPDASFIHLDSNGEMCRYAEQRYQRQGLNTRILNQEAGATSFEGKELDLVTSVNVIYALPDPLKTLSDIYAWLKPGGYFFTIDFGRRQNSLDWTQYFFRELYKREGLLGTAKAIPSAMNLFKRQNEGVAAQDAGDYWLHSTEEFDTALKKIGFEIERSGACYRGYADLAICKKPAHLIES